MSKQEKDVPVGAGPLHKGLRANALGTAATTVIGVASTAPAYSVAATVGVLAAVTGLVSPLMVIVAAVPVFLVALAFRELNRVEPDCGTSFAWVSRSVGPYVGWLVGWAVVVPCVFVMANLAQVASVYTWRLIGADGLAEARWAQAVLGLLWIVVLTALCYRGVRVTARMQAALLAVEVGLLLVFGAVAAWRVFAGEGLAGAPGFGSLFDVDGLGAGTTVAGFMIAVFMYWGWESAVSVNEETRDPYRSPGRAALWSLLLVVGCYAVVSLATMAFAGPKALAEHGDDVLAHLGPEVLGGAGGTLLTLAVLTSAAASAQTTILPTARALLAMGSYHALPPRFGAIHPRYLTPSVATLAMGSASAVVFVVVVSTSDTVLADLISATALFITFVYGVTGLACPWYLRRGLRGFRNVMLRGVLPFTGGVVMALAFARTVVDLADPADAASGDWLGVGLPLWLAAGAAALGLALLLWQRARNPEFFSGRLAGPGDYDGADGLARLPEEQASTAT